MNNDNGVRTNCELTHLVYLDDIELYAETDRYLRNSLRIVDIISHVFRIEFDKGRKNEVSALNACTTLSLVYTSKFGLLPYVTIDLENVRDGEMVEGVER